MTLAIIPLVKLEKDAIAAALRRNGDNIGRAARALGASRRTLMKRMREYGWAPRKGGRRKRRLPYGKPKLKYALPIAGALVGGVLLASRLRGTST